MWIYEKRLQYPVNIKKTCPKTASLIISQFGGPDGELAASMRYLSQRYTMPCGTFNGYRHRRTGSSGNHLRYGISAYQRPDGRTGKDSRI